MPSLATETHYHHHSRPSIDVPPSKPFEKVPLGNAVFYPSGPGNDDYHHFHQPGDRQAVTSSKSTSPSVNGTRSSIGSNTRDRPVSQDENTPPLASGSIRDSREKLHSRVSTMEDGYTNGVVPETAAATQTNGMHGPPCSPSPKPFVNGDVRPSSTDGGECPAVPDGAPTQPQGDGDRTFDRSLPRDQMSMSQITVADNASSLAAPDSDRLAPPTPRSHQRHSSPPAPMSIDSQPSSPSRQSHRHTLQVPKIQSGRKNSRELSDEARAQATGRDSTSSHLRRGSLSLVRRATRSEGHPDEAVVDDDAARWAEAIKQKRARKKRREEEDDDRVLVGTKVDQNHVNWVTAYNMLTGIRFVVSRINAKMDRELTPADFKASHKFSFDVTGNELTPSAKYDFKFKDYAPWVFRSLRAKFKLDPADYLMSLTSKYILSELGSPGKSGSFFYFSRDYKYIIKTIHHAEHKLLRKILPDYYRHVENNPNTLISQFYGLHRVKMAYGRKIHFVVMNNLFPPHRDIHQTFDLKGSTVGRDLREEDLEKNPRATMKDLNWIRRNRHLEQGPEKKEVFMAQVRRDVQLLQSLNIMDYSLLVGIHDLTRGNEEKLRDKTLQVFQPGGDRDEDASANLLTRTPSKLENARKARELRMTLKKERPVPIDQAGAKMPDEILDERKNLVFYSDDGGFRATHEDGQPAEEIYYLGIIDCLTSYGWVKRAENFWKGLSHNRDQISPIPPVAYGERFIKFMEEITMSREEAERKRQEQEAARAGSGEARQSVQDRRSESAERTTPVAADSEALRSRPEPRARTLSTVIDPQDMHSPSGPSTLPVVDEAGEAASEKSGRSTADGEKPGMTDRFKRLKQLRKQS